MEEGGSAMIGLVTSSIIYACLIVQLGTSVDDALNKKESWKWPVIIFMLSLVMLAILIHQIIK